MDAVPAWLESRIYEKAVGTVELPHIDIKQKFDLIPALNDLGISDAFGSQADLSPMIESKRALYVSQVSHDVVFKTNEEGSEAAAVTTAGMMLLSMPAPPREIDFKLNRSFVLAVQDIDTGAVLFTGVVNKPNQDMKPVI